MGGQKVLVNGVLVDVPGVYASAAFAPKPPEHILPWMRPASAAETAMLERIESERMAALPEGWSEPEPGLFVDSGDDAPMPRAWSADDLAAIERHAARLTALADWIRSTKAE